MEKLSPQKEIIVAALRDKRWHCGREWVDRIKDDRKRIQELNDGYMCERGWEIVGEPCKGRACGRAKCPLYMRRAQKLMLSSKNEAVSAQAPSTQNLIKASIEWFDNLPNTCVQSLANSAV